MLLLLLLLGRLGTEFPALAGALKEGILNVDVELSGTLEKRNASQFIGQGLALLGRDLALARVAVGLVANNDHGEGVVVLLDALDLVVKGSDAGKRRARGD